jgi:hypothetical protein
MSSVEQQVKPNFLKKPSSGETKEDILKSLQDYVDANKDEKETEQIDIQKVARKIVLLQLSASELEGIMSKLPIDKRFIVEKMIRDEEKKEISTMSQERYQQFLLMKYPKGAPVDIGEAAGSSLSEIKNLYTASKEEIGNTNIVGNFDFQNKERANAYKAADYAKQSSEELAVNIADIPLNKAQKA